MKAPVVTLKQPGNHGPHAGSICQKICPQRPKPGKYDYFAQPESYSRSGAWEFFTENPLVILELRELETAGRVLGLHVVTAELRRAGDIAPAIEALKDRADALYV